MYDAICTHQNVDLDAVSSVWAARTFIPEAKNARVEFHAADWYPDVDDIERYLILDMRAGIKGEKEANGVTHSCFATLIAKYATPEDQEAIKHLVRFIDTQDAYGSAAVHLLPSIDSNIQDMFQFTGINAVLRAIQSQNPKNDKRVVELMSDIFSGMLKAGRARQRAVIEARRAEILEGKVAIMTNAREFATNGILFSDYGVQAVIYVDGFNIGIIRRDNSIVRMDHRSLRAVIDAVDESAEWFAHPNGFLYCRGSRKSPAASPSKVDPKVLAIVALTILS